MLRLRNAIDRASQNRWLGFLVIACLVVLLVLVAFHVIDDALEGTAALSCLAIALAGAVVLIAGDARSTARERLPRPRGPPASAALRVPVADFLATFSPPLRR